MVRRITKQKVFLPTLHGVVCVCVTAGVDNVDDGESHYSSTVTQEGHIAYYCCIAKKADLQAQNTLTHFELVDQLFLLFLNVNAENEMK